MDLRHFIQAGCLLIATLGLTACSHNKKSPPPPSTRVVVKGDPGLVYSGAQTNSASPINEQNIEDFKTFRLLGTIDFVEKAEVTDRPQNQGDIENENQVTDNTKDDPTDEVRVVRTPVGYDLVLRAGKLRLQLSTQPNGELQLKSIQGAAGPTVPATAIHWSVTPDKNFYSLLLRVNTSDEGRVIAAVYLGRAGFYSAKDVPQADPGLMYVAGPGKKVGWSILKSETLDIQLCGGASKKALVEASVGQWTQYLQGRLNVRFSQTEKYAPFSDLNQHCVYIVDTFREEPEDLAATFGITITPQSVGYLKTVDSDVLMFNGEFEKLRKWRRGQSSNSIQQEIDAKYKLAVVHELGHWFGLDHKFDGTASVMSYDFDYDYPTTYDIKALQTLYPLR